MQRVREAEGKGRNEKENKQIREEREKKFRIKYIILFYIWGRVGCIYQPHRSRMIRTFSLPNRLKHIFTGLVAKIATFGGGG